MNNFTNMLRAHHLKATPQRLAMLELISTYGHINIDKLYEDVKVRFDSISQATIYKNIKAMTKSMILFEVKLPNKKSVYEIVKENHSHLLCTECGEVEDIFIDTNKIIDDISSKHTFKIEQSDVVFSGSCGSCQAN